MQKFKLSIFHTFGIALFLFLGVIHTNALGVSILKDADKYHFCHRCGMAVEKSDKVITVTGVPEKPWYQCCPMCALMDVIETGKGKGVITAYCNQTGQPIKMVITNQQIAKTEPPSTTLLVGGSCSKNKIFYSVAEAQKFIKATPWAKEKMLKSPDKTFAMLKDKKKAITLCSICTTTLKGHEKTWFIVMTTAKKRMVLCCGHCGLFTMYKLKEKAKRATTTDFLTGKLTDAKEAYYVANNDLLLCCFPSTISFASKKDAEKFQKEHGGEILTFQQAMADINKILKK